MTPFGGFNFLLLCVCLSLPSLIHADGMYRYPLTLASVESAAALAPSDLSEIDAALRAVKDEAAERFSTNISFQLRLSFAASTGDFSAAQDVSPLVGAVATGGRITLQPLSVLRDRGLLTAIVRHEAWHAVLGRLFPALPAWFNEGLSAQFARLPLPEVYPLPYSRVTNWGGALYRDAESTAAMLGSAKAFAAWLTTAHPGLLTNAALLNGAFSNAAALYAEWWNEASPRIRVLLNPRGDDTLLAGFGEADVITFFRDACRTNRLKDLAAFGLEKDGITLDGQPCDRAEVIPADRIFKLGGAPYRGKLSVFEHDGTLAAVNTLPIEDYVASVAASEMPTTNLQALAAQCIAARNIAFILAGVNGDADFNATAFTSEQSYRGLGWETPAALAARDLTAGQGLFYRGLLCYPYFSSTCAGRTSAASDVWEHDAPWTSSVACTNGRGEAWCRESPHDKPWDLRFDRSGLSRWMGVETSEISVEFHDAWGRVKSLLIDDQSVCMDDFRARVAGDKGWGYWKSNRFDLRRLDRGDSHSLFWHVTGYGLGHGVGMCQYGAMAQGEAGQNWKMILKFYFPLCSAAPLLPGWRAVDGY